MEKTFVFYKDLNTDTAVKCDLTTEILLGETVTAITAGAISPTSSPALTAQITTGLDSVVGLLLKAGDRNISYGFRLLVTTTARQFSVLVAVTVNSDVEVPYTTQNPEAYKDLVDSVESGKAALGTAIFQFPATKDVTGGYVNWSFLDADGTVYAAGNAFDYSVRSTGVSNIVIAKCIINVPSSVPPSLLNQKYQLQYELILNQGQSTEETFYSSEAVTVIGLNTVPLGTQPAVELQGNKASLSIVTDNMYDKVEVQLYSGNTKIAQAPIPFTERVASGYFYSGTFDTQKMPISLVPYNVVWNYGYSINPGVVYTEQSNLWIVNPSILTAVNDVKAKINKARTTLYGTPDLLFPVETIMLWLRRAADAFNGAYGQFTSFTMTNALGSIREFWLLYAELFALESQYLAEGEKAFDFQGQAISLNVDRTQYYDAAASKIQSRLDNELKPFKQNLIIKGQTGGDGSQDPSRLAPGAIGAVGITISPASPWGQYNNKGISGGGIR